jgi:alkylhydroperoxidase family enzyme
MPAVKLVEKDKADPALKDVFEAAEAHFGHVPNVVKALASNPEMCRSITEFLIQALGPGRLDWGLKEFLVLKTLRAIKSYYGYGAHEHLAVELGVPTAKIGNLASSLWQTSPHFTDPERALLELVEQVAEDANAVSDELWARLRGHWDAGQLLEANAVITTFIMLGRVGDALGVVDPVFFTNGVRPT